MHNTFLISRVLAIAIAFVFLPVAVRAHGPAEEMADAAKNFLAALTPEQQAKAVLDF